LAELYNISQELWKQLFASLHEILQ
jgi:hypothetical protein